MDVTGAGDALAGGAIAALAGEGLDTKDVG